jgi:tetratricopeptide (TPR) repeat protein
MRDPIPGGPGWQMNGETLLAEITELETFVAAHAADRCVHVLTALFQGDPPAARAALEPLLAESPDDARLLALEADIWRDEGRFDAAADRYRRLIWGCDRASLQATLSQHLGKVHFAAGQYADAIECFRRALALREELGASDDLVESSRRSLDRALQCMGSARSARTHRP